MEGTVTLAAASAAEPAGLAPLRGIVGRSQELQRIVAALEAGTSVEVVAAPGVGTTALLRAVCGAELPGRVADGVLGLPVGIPVSDRGALVPEATRGRRLLLVVDDPALTADGVEVLRGTFPRSLLLLAAREGRGLPGTTELPLLGLSVHHSLELLEAAIGRPLTLEEGRAARDVAERVDGRPVDLVRAAALVREAGVSMEDVLGLLDAAPDAPDALAEVLADGLGSAPAQVLDDLGLLGGAVATPAWLEALGTEGPLDPVLRRLAALGVAQSDGRGGYRTALGVADLDASLDRATRLLEARPVAPGPEGGDPAEAPTLLALARVASAVGRDDTLCALAPQSAGLRAAGLPATAHQLDRLTTPAVERVELARLAEEEAARLAAEDEAAAARLAAEAAQAEALAGGTLGADDAEVGPVPEPEASTTPWWRRPRLVALVAAAALAALVLVVLPLLDAGRSVPVETVRASLELGESTVDSPATESTEVALPGFRRADGPLAVQVEGADADAFVVRQESCTASPCPLTVTFTPDRTGAHVAAAVLAGDDGAEWARVALTGTGAGTTVDAAPEGPDVVRTDLAVTIFPPAAPLRAGEGGRIPIGVANAGPDPSTGAVLLVRLGPDATAEAAGCEPVRAGLECSVEALTPGGQSVVTVAVTPGAGSTALPVSVDVTPVTDTDEVAGNDAAGFTFPVRAAEQRDREDRADREPDVEGAIEPDEVSSP
jgi:hypothetical protein